jgi:poly-gamma-glutamate capsule biosynthesis protein CapA/YwtB (metallophosphatase superfamily)
MNGGDRHVARKWTRALTVLGSVAAVLAGLLVWVNAAVLDDSGRPRPAAGTTRAPDGAHSEKAGPASAKTGAAGSSGERSFTVLMSGDVLLRETLWAQAARDADARGESGYDFRPMLAGVRPRISAADLAICHLETPVGERGGPFSDYPVFKVPPQIIPALAWAGYDACTTASNHTLDAGADGVDRTLATLDAAGIAHAGSARTSGEDDRTTILTVHPRGAAGSPGAAAAVKVALLSYTYGLNGFPVPAGKSWIVDTIDPEQILGDAHQARRTGAEVVLVALHWGQEYRNEPTSDQRRIARRLLASPDIDLVYGHHAHVPQPFGRINGKWIAYGLGNHLAEQVSQRERTHEGTMARFTFTERGGRWIVAAAEYIPTAIGLRAPFRLADLPRQLSSDNLTGAERAAARRSYDEVSDIVDSLGASTAGLRPG